MNTIKKVMQLCFQMLGRVWSEVRIRGKVNVIHYISAKEESLIQPSRTTLKGLLRLKNRQVCKMHKLFH